MAKILLVEDDKSLREIYGVRLMAEGYEIVSAGDGEEALALAIKERPDLIVSDVMMPKISGFDMLDILRSTTETKDVKVIMMTALSSEDQRARGESLGADRYLVKSQVGIEDVVRTVHDVLGDGVAGAAPAPSFTPAPAPIAAPAPMAQPTPMPAPAFEPAPAPAPVTPEQYAPPMQTTEPSLPPVINFSPDQSAQLPPAPQQMPAAPAFEQTPAPMAPPAAPVFEPAPAPAPAPAPEQFTPPAPQFTMPQPAPIEVPAPVTPAPAAPAPSVLPEPTAPFSSPRPASLGDRVINPLPSADSIMPTGNIANQINQELTAQMPPLPAQPAPMPQAPPTPPVPPMPQAPTV